MALGGILATALTDRAVRSKGLYLDGLDVVKQPGNTTNPYGVNIDTAEVIEAAPGGVSSMTFTIDDPAIAVTIADGMTVRFHDITADVPIFTGWIQSWTYVPGFGEQGRTIEVRAIGVDAILDWAVTNVALTISAVPATDVSTAIQTVVANSTNIGDLRFFADLATGFSSQATPVASSGLSVGYNAVTIAAGTTMREAIRAICAEATYITAPDQSYAVLVDMYNGLRTFWIANEARRPTDWTALTINDVPAGSSQAEDLRHTVDAANIARYVYVQGGNAAGSGAVSGATGKMGRGAVINDATILTAAARDAAGLAYLAAFTPSARASFWRRAHTPVTTIHAGGTMRITDARASQTSQLFAIGAIRKTFVGALQNWEIEYGGPAPSAIAAIRRLTRSTLS